MSIARRLFSVLAALSALSMSVAQTTSSKTNITPVMSLTAADGSPVSVNGLSLVPVTPTPVESGPAVSVFPVTFTSLGTSYVKYETVTLMHDIPSTALPGQTLSASSSSGSSKTSGGAIAGIVVAAVVVATVAAVLFMHFKNKRSPVHWRNMPAEHPYRWTDDDIESKSGISRSEITSSPYVFGDLPYDGTPDTKRPLSTDGVVPLAPVFVPSSRRSGSGSDGSAHKRSESLKQADAMEMKAKSNAGEIFSNQNI